MCMNNYKQMAEDLELSGDYRVLHRLLNVAYYNEFPPTKIYIGVVVDTETTGLDHNADKIIELAMTPFIFDNEGKIYQVLEPYNTYNDPGMPIRPFITKLTGITDDMVAGKSIDHDEVQAMLDTADIVIAHNAKFDRKFLEDCHAGFVGINWGCSLTDVDWAAEGIVGGKLDYLGFRFGYYFEGHRATVDVAATIHLLTQTMEKSGDLVMKQLWDNSKRTDYRVFARGAPFEMKDILKGRGYFWSPGGSGEPKAWFKDIEDVDLANELVWLKTDIGIAMPDRLPMRQITASNRFSERV